MKSLKLTEREVDQLYVLAMLFAKTGELKKQDFQSGGPARALAEKLSTFLADFPGEITIEKK